MQIRDQFKDCMAHAAARVNVPLYMLMRRGLNAFLVEYEFSEKSAGEIAVGALEQLCSRDKNERMFDFAVCVAVVQFLDETCAPAGSGGESNEQRITDLANIIVSPGTETAYAAWVRAYYR